VKKLIDQILKFGVVGIVCFLVHFIIYTVLNIVFKKTGFADTHPYYYSISTFVGFLVSLVCNYILSMKFVFERKDDMSRKKEFIIFFILSVIGLGINELVLYIGVEMIYKKWDWLNKIMSRSLADTFFFLGATAIVMVYNFISRKIFLEKHD